MLHQIAPWIGYLATILLALALLVNNDIKFRWLNSAGCVAFIIYGIFLNAIPIILTNLLLLSINIVVLIRIYGKKEFFEIIEFDKEGIMVERFIQFYKEDIAKYFPEFVKEDFNEKLNFLVLRNLVIANIFSTKIADDGSAKVFLNYTVDKYRDYKVGRFIFEKEKQFLTSKGVKKIYYSTVSNINHEKFLYKMGFKKELMKEKMSLVKNLED